MHKSLWDTANYSPKGGVALNMDKKIYKKYADARAPKSPNLKNCLRAFLVGGLICTLAGICKDVYIHCLGMSDEDAGVLASCSLVLLTALLTGLGVFDRIAKFAGAGTVVPITGFANAIASQAIDSQSEGWVLGVGAKIFTVAGPVLLYGTVAGVVYGVIYAVVQMILPLLG